jgi:hypothetical protein
VKGLWIVIVVDTALKEERPAKRAFLLLMQYHQQSQSPALSQSNSFA